MSFRRLLFLLRGEAIVKGSRASRFCSDIFSTKVSNRLVHTRVGAETISALVLTFQFFLQLEGFRAKSKPAPNPGTHQTPAETFSGSGVPLYKAIDTSLSCLKHT